MKKITGRIRNFFASLDLSQRFMLASLLILLLGVVGISAWVEHQIVTGVIHRAGATTALYVDSFVSPYLQELGQSDDLTPEHEAALGRLLQDTPMGQQIVALKVWNTRGKLLYTTDRSVVGKTYPMHEGMLRARLGEVVSEISTLNEEENAALGALYDHLLETYSPVWLSGTDQVIAVAEYYHLTDELDREIAVLKQRTWLVVGVVLFLIYLLLAGFVRRTSDTITTQQTDLAQKVVQLTNLLSQNRALHQRVRRASASVALLNEGYLRRIGSELHDGPAQDLGLSLLRLDSLVGKIEDHPENLTGTKVIEQIEEIEVSLQNALKEIRGIAGGLSLPQLAQMGFRETVERVVQTHERQTGTQVELELGEIPGETSLPVKITVYRLIQEGLNNAFRHAGGMGQKVRVGCEEDQLVVEVSDSGPGFEASQVAGQEDHLGLSGMRERVESMEGRFSLESHLGQGTKIVARLPYPGEGSGES